jgi:hypothetical protein
VYVTRDGGSNWTNVTQNIPDLPRWGTISNIEPSWHDAATSYITVDLHQVNNRDPHVYKTTDYGKNWKSISAGIPRSELSYAHIVREDPKRKGLLYLGTENALYASFNDGKSWIPLQNNLPHAPVHWLTIQEHFSDLVIGTYGRGFWILDDITPLRQITPEIIDSDLHLFSPRDAYRFRFKEPHVADPGDQCSGENPPYGASINYYSGIASEGEVEISILDGEGRTIRTLKGERKQGINRIWWDLRYEESTSIKLRTSPVGNPHVTVGSEGWRSTDLGSGMKPLVVPGTYTVKLVADDKEITQTLIVRKDPNSAGSVDDIEAQMGTLLEIRENLASAAGMVNQIEWIRKQIYDLQKVLQGDKSAEPIIEKSKELDEEFIALEDKLIPVGYSGSYARDGLRWPEMFYTRSSNLASGLAQADFPPTTQQKEVHEILSDQLLSYEEEFKQLTGNRLDDFNKLMRKRDVSTIILTSK